VTPVRPDGSVEFGWSSSAVPLPPLLADHLLRPAAGAGAILAGANDPAARSGRSTTTSPGSLAGALHEVYRYDAGHGSLVIDEQIRQAGAEVDFRRHP
jgi:hypothetical protein